VIVCEGAPAVTPAGEIDVIVGAGLFAGVTGGGGVVEVEEAEDPPLQPMSREKVKAEPTKSRRVRRTEVSNKK
jgi:hypothetical protein